jgi:serine/threonine-protein kinase HipA
MNTLDVYMNGIKVGEYTRTKSGANRFTYDRAWLDNPGKRSISLSMPLREAAYQGAQVYNFFDNLLPDAREIRERIVARYDADSTEPFDILSKIGRDCVGAIQLLLHPSPAPDIKAIHAKPLSNNQLAAIFNGYQSAAPLGMLREENDFRISLAGAQEKTALLYQDGNWYLPQKATPTTHIIKLPIGEIRSHDRIIDMTHSVENEFLCLRIAGAYGFAVADCEIMAPNGFKALAVKRFDRRFSEDKSWIVRQPQEDFCQVTGISPAKKYESDGGPGINQIMKELLGSQMPLEDRATFMRTQILFWLLGATDGHAKNFSIFIRPNNQYRLTPLYDILSAYPLISKKGLHEKDLKLAMSLKGKKKRKFQCNMIFPKHFVATAKEVGFSETEMKKMLEDMSSKTEQVIETVEKSLPDDFPTFISRPIFAGMRKMSARLSL